MTRRHGLPPWGYLVLIAVTSMTCDSLDNITVSQTGMSTVPMRTIIDEVIGDIAFLGFDGFDITDSQEFQNQGYTEDQIDSVRVKSLRLSIDSPDNGTFDFMESVEFYAEADGLPRVRIAFLDPVPSGATAIDLELDDVELLDYVVAPSVRVTTAASGTRPEQETTIIGNIDFDVDIDVSGALGCQVAR